jgi:hypothetical protein
LEAAFDPNVKALQDKLIAAGAKIKADGIMGPATRAAQAQFPNVTTQTDAEKAVAANINSANNTPVTPPVAPAPQTSMNTDDEAGTHAFDPTWGGTVATGGQTTAPNANATWNNATQTAVPNPPAAPAAPAGWTPTPEQVKWLGSADQQDPIVMSRMPGVKPPVTHFKDPADQATAKRLGFPAAPAPAAPAGPLGGPIGVPVTSAKESVGYGDEQILARIVELSRR